MPTYAGRYRVIERLGTGAMATVFLAQDEHLGRQVAVKRMRAEPSDEDAERFRREARLAASLNHPNVVKVYDTVTEDEAVVIVMEYVSGVDLGERLEQGPVAPEQAVAILRGVAGALDHAHEMGLIHRDVKPQNILLGEDGETKLTDLGIAKAMQDTGMTKAGVLLGTPQYMAPEQLEGTSVTKAADVYALALVAFHMLSGASPRGSGSIPEVAHRAVNQPPPDIREAWPEAPAGVAEVLSRAMDHDPAVRPASATEFVDGLEAALGGVAPEPATPTRPVPAAAPPPPPAPPPAPVPRPAAPPPAATAPVAQERRPWLGRALAALALVAVAVIALVLITSGSDDEPSSGGEIAQQQQQQGATGTTGGAGGGDASEDPPAEEEPATEPPPAEPPAEEEVPPADEGGSGTGSEDPAPVDSNPPAEAVRDFYELAAAGDTASAWELATPNARAIFGSYETFEGTFATLESIEFTSLETTSETGSTAELALATVATHDTFVDTCSGTASTVSQGGVWLVDDLHVDC